MKMRYFFKYFCKSLTFFKSNIIVLFVLSLLSSFMYFFVQISIDGNMAVINKKVTLLSTDKELFASLQSNEVLALTFLFILSLVTGFVYFMFCKKYCSIHKREFGCFIVNGYSANQMSWIVLLLSTIFVILAYLCGLGLGWIASDIMINLYKEVYSLEYLQKGLTINNALIALLCAVIPTVPAIPIMANTMNDDTATLLNRGNNKSHFRTGKVSKALLSKLSFFLRLALRKPFQLFIIIAAVGIFSILLIMSFSLNLSSQYLFSTMSTGRNYEYDISFKTMHSETTESDNCTFYLSEPININLSDRQKSATIIGIEENNHLLLENMQGKQLKDIPKNTVVISQAMAELYNIEQENVILAALNGKELRLTVFDISKNADNWTIYSSKNTLTEFLSIPNDSFNGIYSSNLSSVPNIQSATVQSINDRETELKNNNVSNRVSAVICQILACVIGCLLFYLTILLKFQEDTKNILILDMMGYPARQINKMLISIYRPMINIAFFLLLIPNIEICKSIHRSLSLATNDFIPFQSSVMVVLIIFVLLNLLYSIIKYSFNLKISTIQKNANSHKYII